MRKFFIVSAFVAMGLIASSSAVASYFYPGRVIIGYGPPPPPPKIGGSANAAAGGGEGCVLEQEIECECFANLTLLEACAKTPTEVGCLEEHTEYAGLSQFSPVLLEGETTTLGSLRCSGLSKDTAYVILPLP